MKKLTISQFKKYCDDIRNHGDLQIDLGSSLNTDTHKLSISFDDIIIKDEIIRSIILTKGNKNVFGKYDNYLRISQIKYIECVEYSCFSTIFNVICSNIKGNSVGYMIEFIHNF